MTDRAISLFRTMLHPVLSSLSFGTARAAVRLPMAPHHAVPAIQLGGVILDRNRGADSRMAEAMYGGLYAFAGEEVNQVPDKVFTCVPPSQPWRVELLRLDWLASFRSSSKFLHDLFALRLISAWVSAKPAYASSDDQIAALYNLAIDAPAIAARQSPAAIAIATTAIQQAQQAVARVKPDSIDMTLARSIALLAAHLACKRSDSYRHKVTKEVTEALENAIASDGSYHSGNIAMLHQLHGRLETISAGLVAAGEILPAGLSNTIHRIKAYFTLLARPDRSLAFSDLKLPMAIRPRSDSALAEIAGHARLCGGKTTLLANVGCSRDTQTLQLEAYDDETPLFWLEQVPTNRQARRSECNLMCAAGGSLLEVHAMHRNGNRQRIAIFLSGDGEDLRLEDSPGEGSAAEYVLHVPEQAKLSTTHGGTGAMLMSGATACQLLVRGGQVILEAGALRIVPDPSDGLPLNFALKRTSKPIHTSRGNKAQRTADERKRTDQSPRLI